MITIVDYGLGNLGSIENILKKIGAERIITGDHTAIALATMLILLAVGAFDSGMRNLRERGLVELLGRKVEGERTPVIGICLGTQLMTESSEEGKLPGLGWMSAATRRFAAAPGQKIPYMDWRRVTVQKPSPLVQPQHISSAALFLASDASAYINGEELIVDGGWSAW